MNAKSPSDAKFVHIIDDDSAIRESLVLLMQSEGWQTRDFASARDFLEFGAGAEYGCVVTDVRMPDMSGLELLMRMKAMGGSWPVVMITAFADVALAVQAMKMGAKDFIEKPCDQDQLVAAVRAALADAGDLATQEAERQIYSRRLEGLSDREEEVLAGLIGGKLNKTIAYEMGVSVRTIETHRAHIMAKTGATSLSELVRMCLLAVWK